MKRIIKGALLSLPVGVATIYLGSCSLDDANKTVTAIKTEDQFQITGATTCSLVQYNGQDSIYSVPSHYTNPADGKIYYVTEISYGAFNLSGFSENSVLTHLTIPATVTKIAESTFENCSQLTNIVVSVANATYSSDEGVLYDKEKKNLIKYPAQKSETNYKTPISVENISANAFKQNTHIEKLELSEKVTSIGTDAFLGCSALTEVNIPSDITEIKKNTFKDCIALSAVDIPDGVTAIQAGAFQGSGIKSVALPSSVETVEHSAFNHCEQLETVTLSDSMTKITDSLFQDCVSLYEVTIPDSITHIAPFAFAGCIALESIEIPNSVLTMQNNIFEGCTNLSTVMLSDSISKIAKNTFKDCVNLTVVVLPDSVTEIESYAFKNCKNLININFPEKITSLGKNTFSDCVSLGKVILPPNLKSLSDSVFANSKIEELHIPANTTSVSASSFNKATIGTVIIDSSSFSDTYARQFFSKLLRCEYVYIADELTVNNYISNNYTQVTKSDMDGYKEFTKNK
ncbi:MAG: leucine-rich repeat domain-containing protein [Acholeplasmatales bacterium]|nr:leucine-rich repeat domain-containing protein [Acholeplasmatales bacterium]